MTSGGFSENRIHNHTYCITTLDCGFFPSVVDPETPLCSSNRRRKSFEPEGSSQIPFSAADVVDLYAGVRRTRLAPGVDPAVLVQRLVDPRRQREGLFRRMVVALTLHHHLAASLA
jgi:hypothetical protein